MKDDDKESILKFYSHYPDRLYEDCFDIKLSKAQKHLLRWLLKSELDGKD